MSIILIILTIILLGQVCYLKLKYQRRGLEKKVARSLFWKHALFLLLGIVSQVVNLYWMFIRVSEDESTYLPDYLGAALSLAAPVLVGGSLLGISLSTYKMQKGRAGSMRSNWALKGKLAMNRAPLIVYTGITIIPYLKGIIERSLLPFHLATGDYVGMGSSTCSEEVSIQLDMVKSLSEYSTVWYFYTKGIMYLMGLPLSVGYIFLLAFISPWPSIAIGVELSLRVWRTLGCLWDNYHPKTLSSSNILWLAFLIEHTGIMVFYSIAFFISNIRWSTFKIAHELVRVQTDTEKQTKQAEQSTMTVIDA